MEVEGENTGFYRGHQMITQRGEVGAKGSLGLGARRTGSNVHACYLWGLDQFTVPQ